MTGGRTATFGSIVYLDTSALAALLVEQPESEALLTWLDCSTDTLVSGDLLETELRRLALRKKLDQTDVTRLLEAIEVAALDRAVYRSAGLLPMPCLRTLDALHLEAAIRLDADAVLKLRPPSQPAPRTVGLQVSSPGRNDSER